MTDSRRKGATFERRIACDLRKWLGSEWTVARNPTSFQAGEGGAGEFSIVYARLVLPPHESRSMHDDAPLYGRDLPTFPWAIECKAAESFRYQHLLTHPIPGPFPGWWAQACRQAASAGLQPLLVVKRNRGPILVAARRLRGLYALPRLRVKLGDEEVRVWRWAALMGTDAGGMMAEGRR